MPLNSSAYTMSQPMLGHENPYYKCHIVCPDENILITANLPAEYSMDLGAAYEASFSQGIKDKVNPYVGGVASAFGVQFVTKALTAKVWQGSNELSFTLPLILQLETDPYLDILKPLSDLYKLVLPKEVTPGGLLESPGPSLNLEKIKKVISSGGVDPSALLDPTSDLSLIPNAISTINQAILSSIERNVFLVIGGHQYFDSVIVTNVSQNTVVQPFYKTGTMSRVEVAVTFSTFFVPTRDDIPRLLLNSDPSSVPSDGGASDSGALSTSQVVNSNASTTLEVPLSASPQEYADFVDSHPELFT